MAHLVPCNPTLTEIVIFKLIVARIFFEPDNYTSYFAHNGVFGLHVKQSGHMPHYIDETMHIRDVSISLQSREELAKTMNKALGLHLACYKKAVSDQTFALFAKPMWSELLSFNKALIARKSGWSDVRVRSSTTASAVVKIAPSDCNRCNATVRS